MSSCAALIDRIQRTRLEILSRLVLLSFVKHSDQDADVARLLGAHVRRLLRCRRCPNMHKPVVSGGAIVSKVLLVGQAPGDKEPLLKRPFAWTAGQTLFRWFNHATGITEDQFRSSVYMAAVCRCFPGKKLTGGDRVPSREEVGNCSLWLANELEILQPTLVIPVGKLAIEQFLARARLDEVIGRQFRVRCENQEFDLIPLPHPSGASPWPRIEPGKTLVRQALDLIRRHASFRELIA